MQKLTEKADVLSKDFIQETKAECLFLRGLYLFQLGKEFKDAPLRLTASQSVADFPLKKSTQKEIWDQAINCYLDCNRLQTGPVPSGGNTPNRAGH